VAAKADLKLRQKQTEA